MKRHALAVTLFLVSAVSLTCVHHLNVPAPTLPLGQPAPEPMLSTIDIPLVVDLTELPAKVNAEIPPGVDAMGAWTYPRNDALAGWCGNCKDHCAGGTEEECTESCNRDHGEWDDGPCHRDCDDGWLSNCYRNCNGSKGCEGWCGGDGLRGCHAKCSGIKNQRTQERQGCLNACGGQKGCRDSWCVDEGPERKACYAQAGADGFRVGLKYKATRTDISLAITGNEIRASTGVDYEAEGCWQYKKPWPLEGYNCTKLASCGQGEPKRRVDAAISSQVFWSEEWHLISKTKFDLSFPNKCEITVVNYDVTPRIADFLRNHLGAAVQRLDERVASLSNLKPIAGQAWSEIQQPREIANGIWFVVEPTEARVAPLNAADLKLSTSVGASARIRLVFGEKPQSGTAALPKLTLTAPASGINVQVRGTLAYASVTEQLRKALKGTTLNVGDESVLVRDIKMYGSNGSPVMAADVTIPRGFWRSTDVTLYLTGRPTYDVATNTIAIEELDYTAETKALVLQAFAWLSHDKILKKFREKARWQAGEWLAKARSALSAAFPIALAAGITLEGEVLSVQPQSVLTTSDELLVYVNLSGRARLVVSTVPLP